MAHSCPICDQACYCKGDIDDIFFDQEPAGGCIHYKSGDCEDDDYEYEDEYEDDDYWDDDDTGETELQPTKDGGLHDPETGITHYP